jgi:hypothetical protein
MSLRLLIVSASLVVVLAMGSASDACAQGRAPTAGPHHTRPQPRPRIEVNPGRLLYRRCVSWYELQYRPSGTVLFPAQHCWWVRG